jgi:hypothetical protein
MSSHGSSVQQEISERLKLDQIEQAVAAADPAKLDAWLRARLEDFLEAKLGDDAIARLEEIRAAIRGITELGPEFHKKALAALRRDYQFSLSVDSGRLPEGDHDEGADRCRVRLRGRCGRCR